MKKNLLVSVMLLVSVVANAGLMVNPPNSVALKRVAFQCRAEWGEIIYSGTAVPGGRLTNTFGVETVYGKSEWIKEICSVPLGNGLFRADGRIMAVVKIYADLGDNTDGGSWKCTHKGSRIYRLTNGIISNPGGIRMVPNLALQMPKKIIYPEAWELGGLWTFLPETQLTPITSVKAVTSVASVSKKVAVEEKVLFAAEKKTSPGISIPVSSGGAGLAPITTPTATPRPAPTYTTSSGIISNEVWSGGVNIVFPSVRVLEVNATEITFLPKDVIIEAFYDMDTEVHIVYTGADKRKVWFGVASQIYADPKGSVVGVLSTDEVVLTVVAGDTLLVWTTP